MKTARTVAALVLTLLMIFGWSTYIGNLSSSSEKHAELLSEARDYCSKKLYVKSVNTFRDALSLESSEDVWKEMTDVNRLAYEEKSLTFSDYVANLKAACDACPDNMAYWKELLSETKDKGSSKDSFAYAQAARENGITDEEVLSLALSIIYDYKFIGRSYSEVITSSDGISTVRSGSVWGMIGSDDSEIWPTEYNYISPAGKEDVLLITDMWAHIVDTEGVAQSVIVNDITDARAYGEGYLPVKSASGIWSYIRCSDNEAIGNCADISSFNGGFAVINEGSAWEMINTDLNKIGVSFEDVRLFANGDYINDGIIVAKVGGKYSLYDISGNNICEKTADDIDIYMGGFVAYKEDGLWGFMDKSGETVIKPRFEEARSFSNGLAAVLSDGLWGFINEDGRIVIEPQFADVGYFDSGFGCYVYLGQWQKITLKNW